MKRLFVLVACAVVLGGCASRQPVKTVSAPAKAAPAYELVDANGVPIERVPFRAGVSSVTVENMAKAEGCVGGQGAGLMTPQGPVEVYRMICSNRRVYMARCEFRQCMPIGPQAPAYAPPRSYAPAPVPAPQPAAVVLGVAPPARVVSTSPVATPVVVLASAPMAQVAQSERLAPRLLLDWRCKKCTGTVRFKDQVMAGYEKEAAAHGYTVSMSSTAPAATLSIRKFEERTSGAGNYTLTSRVLYAGRSEGRINGETANAAGVDTLGETIGKSVFSKIFPPAGK